ncbi:Phosphatidylethanolamine-binding protein [uncultured archaeon]|nr:Phosphatidylethanolamine-binding protein [uncultured archaeon]
MKYLIRTALAAMALLLLVVQAEEVDMKNIDVNLGFAKFPEIHTCLGMDTSPKIEIQVKNVTSLAMILEDPDAPSGVFTHWLIWNIPPLSVIPQAILHNATVTKPFSAIQGTNSFGEIGYSGPCPPQGKAHRYFLRAFGLDSMLNIKPGASRQELVAAMQGHVLAQGEAMATFKR